GSLGSHTAAMLAPYADRPSNSGIPRYEQAKLTAMTKERLNAGFQIGFHAIGDKGVQMALDAFDSAEKDAAEKDAAAKDAAASFSAASFSAESKASSAICTPLSPMA